MTRQPDDRRLLDRDAAGTQPPAPVERPTPPEKLPSRGWTEAKRDKWLIDLTRSPRDVVARALHKVDLRPSAAGHPLELWSELSEEDQEDYLLHADFALEAVAPLLRSPTFRSVQARRDAELAQALSTVRQLTNQVDDLVAYQLRLEAKLQRYREAVRSMAKIIQRKRAGANREVAYYKSRYHDMLSRARRDQR